MDVSVCIVNWNTKDLIGKCINSIMGITSGLTYEIIVVDNNSKDSSTEMLRTKFPDCKLIASSENLGFARGNNLAVKHATGKYILFLNPDTELITNALYGMFDFMEKNREFAAVGCKLIYPDGKIQYTCASTFPTPFRELSFLLLLNRAFPKSKLLSARELDFWDHMDSKEVDCLSGACIMASRALVEKLDGFDENIFMYSEDLDLCYRILKEGCKINYLASEVIMHYEGASSSKKTNTHFAALLQKQSTYYFMNKHYGNLSAICFRVSICVGSIFRILLTVPLMIASGAKLIRKGINPRHVFDKYANLLLWSIYIRRPSTFD